MATFSSRDVYTQEGIETGAGNLSVSDMIALSLGSQWMRE